MTSVYSQSTSKGVQAEFLEAHALELRYNLAVPFSTNL